MSSRRLKTIILLMLLAANLFTGSVKISAPH